VGITEYRIHDIKKKPDKNKKLDQWDVVEWNKHGHYTKKNLPDERNLQKILLALFGMQKISKTIQPIFLQLPKMAKMTIIKQGTAEPEEKNKNVND